MNLNQLTAEQAAAIAARHGLGIDAAVSLQLLADDVEQAERLAAIFEHHDAA